MRLVKKQSEEWIKNFCNWYNANQMLIFEAFINYYGEEERDIIIQEIDNIEYIFALANDAYLNCQNIPENAFTKRLKLYFSNNKLVLDTLSRKGVGDTRIISVAANASMLAKYPRRSFEYHLHEDFVSKPNTAITYFDPGESPIIVLPIYFVNERVIFHEINHVFTTPKEKENLFPSFEVDELLNELMSQDILKIFKKLGGKILPYDLDIDMSYDDNTFLMREFYEKFKGLIKNCIKNKDLKILEDNLGKENLYIYFALVKKLFNKKYITDIDLERIKFLIYRMEQYNKTRKACYNRVRLRKVA